MSCDLFVFAGEKSADLHGEKLIQALRIQHPHLNISGVGGPKMRSAGMHCLLPMEEFQVMGFIDVLWALPKLLRHFYFIAHQIRKLNPKAVITIDYPGFNLRLAKYLRRKGFQGKLIHYICPSVWAWGKKRIPLMGKTLDLLLSILPFEKELFASTSLEVSFVGHPLLERIHTYTYKKLPIPSGKKIIALFPGSRKKEIARNLPLLLDVCRFLLKEHPQCHIALSVSDEKFRPALTGMLREKGWDEKELSLIPADLSYELMKASHLAFAKSGTVTLELALHRTPTVVVYGVSALDKIIAYDILRIRLPYYCLVNIIARKEVFPELIGPHFTVDQVKKKAEELFKEPSRRAMQQACDAIIEQLGSQSASQKAATEILRITQLISCEGELIN
jgi:lipid-A-disaccharide synthase